MREAVSLRQYRFYSQLTTARGFQARGPVAEGLQNTQTHEPNGGNAADKERGGKKEISSVVIKMKNGSPATLNKS